MHTCKNIPALQALSSYWRGFRPCHNSRLAVQMQALTDNMRQLSAALLPGKHVIVPELTWQDSRPHMSYRSTRDTTLLRQHMVYAGLEQHGVQAKSSTLNKATNVQTSGWMPRVVIALYMSATPCRSSAATCASMRALYVKRSGAMSACHRRWAG